MGEKRIISNNDVVALDIGVSEGHKHLRTVIRLRSGEELVLQEATVANLVRAYVSLKTHPCTEKVHLTGKELSPGTCKEGFADWQLIEEE